MCEVGERCEMRGTLVASAPKWKIASTAGARLMSPLLIHCSIRKQDQVWEPVRSSLVKEQRTHIHTLSHMYLVDELDC